MPFISLVMGPQTHKDYSHSKVVHDSKHQTFIRVMEEVLLHVMLQ